MMSIRILTAAQSFRIDDRYFITPAMNADVKSMFRPGALTNTTLVHVGVQEKLVTIRPGLTHVEVIDAIANLS